MRRVRFNNDNANNFDRQFKERLRNLEVESPQGTWDKVAFELDEERERTKHDHWYYALLILLIPLTVANIWINYDLESYYNSLRKTKNEQAERILGHLDYYTPAQLLAYGDGAGLNAYFNPELVPPLNGENDAPKISENDDNAAIASTKLSLEDVTTRKIDFLPNSNLHAELVRKRLKRVRPTKFKNNLKDPLDEFKGFYFGVDAAFNNSHVLVNKGALEPTIGEDMNRERDWGRYFGLSFGYDFSHKYGLELEWIFRSLQGQRYWEKRYGKILINGEINLVYMHLPLLFKYKFTRISHRTGEPRVINLVLGPQYSRLRNASIVANDSRTVDVAELFNKNELGLVMGIEYDVFVNKNYSVSFGLRSSLSSAPNRFPYFVTKDPETYNFLIGVNTSINYHIAKQNRKR